jgi:LacI family transcriptional regulator
LISADTNAVLLTPFFKKESLSLTEKLTKHQIPFSFLDSMIEQVDFISYYGQDSFQSGYIAAKLMFEKQTDIQKVLIVRTKRKGESFSNQTEQRLLGFKHYMQHQQLNNIELIHHESSNSDAEKEISDLKLTFDKHPDILGAITFNSKAYKLADQLHQLHQNKIKLIGYDLLSENVKYLKEGQISYLIAQQPVKQAYFAIRDLCRKFVFHQEINKINFMPVDILIRENIDYYINFDEII